MENSNAEKLAGMNISYENSFSAIKKDILKETVDKKKVNAFTKEIIPIEEKPNKPKEKQIVKNVNQGNNSMNMTHDSRPVTVEELLNRSN